MKIPRLGMVTIGVAGFLLMAFALAGGAVHAEDCKPPTLSHHAYWIARPFMDGEIVSYFLGKQIPFFQVPSGAVRIPL